MLKLTVMEFKNFCCELAANTFILHDANQTWGKVDNTFGFKIELNHISVNFNPNIVKLMSGSGCIVMKRVKYVNIDDSSVLGTVLTIVCGNNSDAFEKSYTIIAR